MIATKGLKKQYGSVVALHELDLEIDKGVIFGYVGPNGAGKTTTIRILCGLLTPTSGTARVAGIDVLKSPDQVRARVGYMPDYLVPYEGMRVWEYLDFFGAAYGIPRRTRQQRVDQVLELTGARALRDYYVETLSHGMRQRLGVARALIHDPEVLLLDEPANGLDPRARVEMRVLLLTLKDLGKTILLSSHILHELAAVSDCIGFMEQGKLIAYGSVKDVQRKVHPHRVFELEVLKDAEAAEQETIRHLAREKVHGTNRIENLIRVELEATDEEVSQWLGHLVQSGYSLVGFREVMTDLEQTFLALTSTSTFGKRRTEGD